MSYSLIGDYETEEERAADCLYERNLQENNQRQSNKRQSGGNFNYDNFTKDEENQNYEENKQNFTEKELQTNENESSGKNFIKLNRITTCQKTSLFLYPFDNKLHFAAS